MIFCRRSQRELLAILEQERVNHERDLTEIERLNERLSEVRLRLADVRRTVNRQTDSICVLGGKINAIRQACDSAANFGTHVSIARIREIADE